MIELNKRLFATANRILNGNSRWLVITWSTFCGRSHIFIVCFFVVRGQAKGVLTQYVYSFTNEKCLFLAGEAFGSAVSSVVPVGKRNGILWEVKK
ncbi:hypothetical protein PICMEDRAFT_15816 [Pichia membranifaciens NRRL Y-2026]|uniref:Uncharacterized protein n=1 Tax=Pichia membranifaciens NRRL Y-2026 TaxID=763406 RepID=A0A1E3NPJ7_9ASCO|nr:hypothetical protein PICMEDRAFT_15816 [Pichia membranifaciens NRRL Y-2026]ODQ47946.1 hypothetical protein PICMEDRAFT_15816 [Pichia membranifaciens NRRL Y-2026]